MTDPQPTDTKTLADGRTPLERQLGSGAKGLARLREETEGLVADVREWVDLRIELAKIEVEERIDERLNQLLLAVIMAVILLFIAIFLLITIALGLGWWLGHPMWGFLIVTGVLALTGATLYRLRPRLTELLRSDEEPLPSETEQVLPHGTPEKP